MNLAKGAVCDFEKEIGCEKWSLVIVVYVYNVCLVPKHECDDQYDSLILSVPLVCPIWKGRNEIEN